MSSSGRGRVPAIRFVLTFMRATVAHPAPPLGGEVEHGGTAARLPREELPDRLVRDPRPLDVARREEPRQVPGEVRCERRPRARLCSADGHARGRRNVNRPPGNGNSLPQAPGTDPLTPLFLRHFEAMPLRRGSFKDYLPVDW
jgi:hypothetical protein